MYCETGSEDDGSDLVSHHFCLH